MDALRNRRVQEDRLGAQTGECAGKIGPVTERSHETIRLVFLLDAKLNQRERPDEYHPQRAQALLEMPHLAVAHFMQKDRLLLPVIERGEGGTYDDLFPAPQAARIRDAGVTRVVLYRYADALS